MSQQQFSTEITVRITDINYGGHLANDTVLSYFHEARVRYLAALGVSEADIGDETALTQTEAHIEYKNEGFLGDLLTIFVWIDEIARVRFRVNYDIVREKDGKHIAQGYVVLAGFDYETRRPKKIPESFREKIQHYHSN
jgi:acyl-CoA thioesterase FadM